ncbi:hypothetical protein [Microbulbifer hydrolyticus]|uniref:Lipoprotein n=1 Tax=Microbulbifer hydrolyticus TaxID=48074 RepID=A0A6P1T8Z0_9GAMM|nr:hypothetical protein [Microbulbifer hydrolyticus]MBB5210226.1 hypothetical protein [Microbulbifer hydrolyticus]QHQ39268.1 hypothetical protein GTQ55_09900 [Microbulbifer hydrolyticus]
MIELVLAASLAVDGCNAPDTVESAATVVGRASGVEEPDVRYCEYFLPRAAGEVRVVYYTPGQPQANKIAEKHITGDAGRSGLLQDTRPQISQEDFRSGEVREATRVADGWRLRYRANRNAEYRDKVFSDGQLDVIDAGFDALVRRHWSVLKAGEELQFQFASPVHGRTIGLRAAATPCQNPEADLCIRVDLAQAILRWIAGGDIYLEYAESADQGQAEPKLMRFVGVTNLLDRSGDPQRLNLEYFYR